MLCCQLWTISCAANCEQCCAANYEQCCQRGWSAMQTMLLQHCSINNAVTTCAILSCVHAGPIYPPFWKINFGNIFLGSTRSQVPYRRVRKTSTALWWNFLLHHASKECYHYLRREEVHQEDPKLRNINDINR